MHLRPAASASSSVVPDRPAARPLAPWLPALGLAALLAACGGSGSDPVVQLPEETRAHDTRVFNVLNATATTFEPMAGVAATATSRWAGVLDGAGYHVEVPANWNGRLVMYAHGYAGTGQDVFVQQPSIRRYLIENGYAWAASSYSKNYYDVRAGVEDTNALARAFNRIAADNGRALGAPAKTFIIGHSMGGHVSAAAVEAETLATARNRQRYDGAVPMCGVMGDTELFDTFAAMQLAAQTAAGQPDHPLSQWSQIAGPVTGTLFSSFPSAANPGAPVVPQTTPQARDFLSALQHLTGGERPLFEQALQFGGSLPSAWSTFGSDGTLDGILNRNVLDTRRYTYTYRNAQGQLQPLNVTQVITPESDANRLRTDGLRWVPRLQGEIGVPVVTLHTLGDLFVPFSMQQVYQRRVADKGNGRWLVQRAIRGASHCDFTVAEQVRAFQDMVAWESTGVKPAGDDVLDAQKVAEPTYGCTFTNDTLGPDERGSTVQLRSLLNNPAVCTGT